MLALHICGTFFHLSQVFMSVALILPCVFVCFKNLPTERSTNYRFAWHLTSSHVGVIHSLLIA